MADVNKTIQISYEARTQDLENALKRIPNITEREAREMARSLERNLKKTERAANRSSKKIGASFKKAGRAVGSIAGAAAIAGAGILMFGQQLADLSNQLNDASVKTGLTAETLSGLRLAANGAGVSFEQLEPGLIKFQQSIQAAEKDTSKQAKAFKNLGVELRDNNGEIKGTQQLFNELAVAMSNQEDQTLKNTAAMDLFGLRAGPGLIQTGALDNLGAFVELSRDFGVNMGEVSQDAANFQRAMAEVKETLQGAGAEILQVMVGTEDLTSAIFTVSDQVVFFSSIFEDVFRLVGSIFTAALGPINLMNSSLTSTVFLLESILTGDFEGFKSNLSNIATEAFDVVDAFSEAGNNVVDFEHTIDQANIRVEELRKAREKILTQNEKEKRDTKQITALSQEQAEQQEKASKKELDKEKELQRLKESSFKELVAISESSRKATLTADQLEIEALEAKKRRILELKEITGDDNAARIAMHNFEIEQDMVLHEQQMRNEQALRDKRLATADISIAAVGNLGNSIHALHLANMARTREGFEITKEQVARYSAMIKAAAVAEIAINTAVAIQKALATLGPIAGAAAAGLIGASGATQTAAVLMTPGAFHMGGMIGNRDPIQPGETMVRALKGEAILDQTTVQSIGGAEGVAALQRGQGMGPQVIVLNPFKHLDRYNKSALRQNSTLNTAIRGARSFGSGSY